MPLRISMLTWLQACGILCINFLCCYVILIFHFCVIRVAHLRPALAGLFVSCAYK